MKIEIAPRNKEEYKETYYEWPHQNFVSQNTCIEDI